MKRKSIAVLAAVAMVFALCLVSASPAQARDSWGFAVGPGGFGFSYGHGHGHYHGGYHGGYYGVPYTGVYAAPPVYYAPRVYYGPPAYYGPVGYGWYGHGCW